MSCLRSATLLTALACAACGPSGTPEDELRALVDEAEALAESRDAGDYRDASGRDAPEVRNLLHAWLVAHPSVNLLTRIDSLELEGTELARLQVTVGMLGREATQDSDWDLAADVERLDLRLAREGGKWRVISAR